MSDPFDIEMWKPFGDGRYLVSSHGRVYGFDVFIRGVGGGTEFFRINRAKMFKTNISPDGYRRVTVYGKPTHIHRLVAEAFMDGYTEHLSINHKDGDKLNNNVLNLESISLSENTRHAWDIGLCDKQRTGVRCIDTGQYFASLHDAARSLQMAVGNLCSHLKGNQKSFAGKKWEYAD